GRARHRRHQRRSRRDPLRGPRLALPTSPFAAPSSARGPHAASSAWKTPTARHEHLPLTPRPAGRLAGRRNRRHNGGMKHDIPPPPRPALADDTLWNEDLAPTRPELRTWNRWHIAALWVGMAVCIPTYTLA